MYYSCGIRKEDAKIVVTGKCTDVETLKEMMYLKYTDANLYIFEKGWLNYELKKVRRLLGLLCQKWVGIHLLQERE